MAIPSGTIFSSTPSVVSEKKSALNNARHEGYTIGDLADAVTAIQDAVPATFEHVTLAKRDITCSAGGTTTFDRNDNCNIYLLDWNGANGSHVYNLPTAASIANVVLRFASNGSFNNSTNFVIDASGAELIDGQSTYTLNRAHHGVALYSTGQEWLVIQAKA